MFCQNGLHELAGKMVLVQNSVASLGCAKVRINIEMGMDSRTNVLYRRAGILFALTGCCNRNRSDCQSKQAERLCSFFSRSIFQC